jgi:hypothetical protein
VVFFIATGVTAGIILADGIRRPVLRRLFPESR